MSSTSLLAHLGLGEVAGRVVLVLGFGYFMSRFWRISRERSEFLTSRKVAKEHDATNWLRHHGTEAP